MAIQKKKSKLIAANVAYIDPVSCGSTIGYKIVDGSRSIWAELDLTDCNRKINWSFYSKDGLGKIDKALAMLTEFRTAWAETKKLKPRAKRARTT